MQNISKRFILAGCLAASVLVTGLTGCKTENRTAGNYLDDHEIAHRVASTLNHDPVYKFEDVKVDVFQGVVQLSGFVDTQGQIRVASDRASHTEGVRQVINDIAIKPQFKLVPAGQEQSMYDRRYQSNAGNAGASVGETTGGYSGQNGPGAPVITPSQGSPSTPATGGDQTYGNPNKQNQNQNQNYNQLNNQRGLNQDQNQRNP